MHSRPWRVLLLAIFAVVAMTGTMAGASELMRKASGDHYADEVLRTQLANLDRHDTHSAAKRPA